MNNITDDYPFVFVDPESVKLFELATKVAKTDIPAMITGPSGTGKEVLARVLHESSNRSDSPFVALNCAAIPDNLVEDTLFGHEKGAFTGAHQINKGFFEEAEGGTLFLDEIGEMPISLQSKLLRVLQEKQIYRVGATKPINVNVRIVSATNINIKEAIHNKLFREDLYFRLSGFVLGIRKLCERKADIEPLTRIFVQKHASAFRPEICRNAIEKLTDHDWPGNVRELENVILRAMVLLEGDRLLEENIMFDDFSEHNAQGNENSYPDKNSNVFDLQNSRRRFNWQPGSELEDILDALKMHSTRDKAAAELGISPRTLRQKLYEFRKAGFSVPGAYART
ncbi:MAG: sigma-54 dependent transcriptional regulator [Gammaproteobacteria bacterium]|nr:sigma-54 dependent transcriptional regulator [Gammaproteobacteria bacterium]